MKPLANKSIEEFRKLLKDYCDEHDPKCQKYPVWLRKEFWNFWTGKNDGGRKHYFQMEDKWNTGLRLATFVKNSQKDPRWKTQPKKDNVYRRTTRMKEGQMALSGFPYEKFNVNK